MPDPIDSAAEADANPHVDSDELTPNENTNGTADAVAIKDPHLLEAIKGRDKAKALARAAEARAGELEAKLAALTAERDGASGDRDKFKSGFERLANGALERFIDRTVDPSLRKAARVVLAGIDLLTADETALTDRLRDAGLLGRDGGSPKPPGVNLGMKPPHERPGGDPAPPKRRSWIG